MVVLLELAVKVLVAVAVFGGPPQVHTAE